MRKIVLASAIAITAASSAFAGNLSPVVPEAPVEIVPAAPAGSSFGGIWPTLAVVGLVGALVAASASDDSTN